MVDFYRREFQRPNLPFVKKKIPTKYALIENVSNCIMECDGPAAKRSIKIGEKNFSFSQMTMKNKIPIIL